MALRSVQFVLSVNLLTVCKEEFTVRKMHVIIDTYNISLLFSNALRGAQWRYDPFSSHGPLIYWQSVRKSLRLVNYMSLSTLKIFPSCRIGLGRGAVALRSIQFVRSVNSCRSISRRWRRFVIRTGSVASFRRITFQCIEFHLLSNKLRKECRYIWASWWKTSAIRCKQVWRVSC